MVSEQPTQEQYGGRTNRKTGNSRLTNLWAVNKMFDNESANYSPIGFFIGYLVMKQLIYTYI